MSLVKQEFGEDAVILDTRRTRKSFFGLFGSEWVEVTAALDVKRRATEKARVSIEPLVPRKSIDVRQEAEVPPREGSAQVEPQPTPVQRTLRFNAPPREDVRLGRLETQIEQISTLLQALVEQRSDTPASDNAFAGAVGEVYSAMLACDVDAALAQDLCSELVRAECSELDALFEHLRQALLSRPFTCGPIRADDSEERTGPKVVVLVGPTGVGKTTTLAKISADLIVYEDQPVAYITQDTYRLAASDQLQKYADILGVSLKVVYEPEDLAGAVADHAHCRFVFVDTAGRSQHNESQMEELVRLMDNTPQAEAHLVLSAGTKNRELLDTVEQFSRIPLASLIFTKLDEALTCGSLFSIAHRSGLGVSYCTNGQNVPEDFFVADAERLAELLIENLRGALAPRAALAAVEEEHADEPR